MEGNTEQETREIARGYLSWGRHERVADRYGCIVLGQDPDFNRVVEWPEAIQDLEGTPGRMTFEITETRPSEHIGDLFHGVVPIEAEVGSVVELGDGYFFVGESGSWAKGVGVRPLSGESTLWMSLKGLYTAHEQEGILRFEPRPEDQLAPSNNETTDGEAE